MNYTRYEALRADVAALTNRMIDLRTTLNALEARYHYDADPLPERLARHSLCRINALFFDAYQEVLVLDACFKD